MDPSMLTLLWPGLLFAFGCYIMTEVIARTVVGLVPRAKVNHYWAEVVLPTLPVLIGGLVALCWKTYPYPVENANWKWRLLLGIVAGYTAAWAVKIIKAIIKNKTGVDVDVQAPAGSTVSVHVEPNAVPQPPAPPADPGPS